ncbi:MAG TPA: hypothetical protein VI138_01100 [Candidatus Dormibacteraeota bacterium]
MAGVAAVGLVLGSLVTACGSTRLGGLTVATAVTSNGSTASTPTVPQGTEVDVRITISNVSQNSVGGVTVRVPVPKGFTYLATVTTSTNGNSVRSADVAPKSREATLTWGSWAMGPRAGNSKSQVHITAELRATGTPATAQFSPTVFATGFVNSLTGTPLGLTISPAPALGLQLRVTPAATAPGQRLTYQVTVTNTGSGEAPDTSIGVTLPDDFDYAGSAGSSGDASLGNASFPNTGTEIPIWSDIDLPGAGSSGPGSLTLTFSVLVLPVVPKGTYTCSATLVASTGSQTQNYLQTNYGSLAPVQVS